MPYYASAWKIVDACDRGILSGAIAAHSVPDIYYILRKSIPTSERKEVLCLICNILDVVDIDRVKLVQALENDDFKDFEDCLQSLCAKAVNADFIVTRNPNDFAFSSVPPILPDQFCLEHLDGN